jgi:hypothetical protein
LRRFAGDVAGRSQRSRESTDKFGRAEENAIFGGGHHDFRTMPVLL